MQITLFGTRFLAVVCSSCLFIVNCSAVSDPEPGHSEPSDLASSDPVNADPANVELSNAKPGQSNRSALQADHMVFPVLGCCPPPRDCQDLGYLKSGIYTIYPEGTKVGIRVYCDMDTDGGGWTVFQRRQDDSMNFYRNWNAYQFGFGYLYANFWLGNQQIHTITAQGWYELRVDLEDFDSGKRYAKYNLFRIEDYVTNYRLVIAGYNGNAGDSLSPHNAAPFSTKDRDNDMHSDNCAVLYKGAWWYNKCHSSNLNGIYHAGAHSSYADGVNWQGWRGYRYSLKSTEMKVRRK
ncbi:hypothetical protein ScPMuIL_001469 [Solemya velum]